MDDREERKDKLFHDLKVLSCKIDKINSILMGLNTKMREKKQKFESLDYELAMENRTIIPLKKTSKPREVRKLTIEEIKSIAIKLGVEITIKGEDESDKSRIRNFTD